MLHRLISKLEDNSFNLENINLEKLLTSLKKLDHLAELENIKNSVAEIVIGFILEINFKGMEHFKKKSCHTLIYGPPGVGKSELAKCIANIYQSFGLINVSDKKPINYVKELYDHYHNKQKIPNEVLEFYWTKLKQGDLGNERENINDIIYASRSDLIAHYSGQTSSKTKNFLNNYLGGCLIIEEAYNLCTSDSDGYGRECLTEISQFMDKENSPTLILTGYEDQIKEHIFNVQPGLSRRFNMIFRINGYSPEGLANIFKDQIESDKWKLDPEIELVTFFKNNYQYFPFFGGDTLRLSYSCKIIAAIKIVQPDFDQHLGIITSEDFSKGFDRYINNTF